MATIPKMGKQDTPLNLRVTIMMSNCTPERFTNKTNGNPHSR